MPFQTARPTGSRGVGGPTIGAHRAIPAPPPPPQFKVRDVQTSGRGNGDILRALASFSADIDRFVDELDNYSARCTDYFYEILSQVIENQSRQAAGQRQKQVSAVGAVPIGDGIVEWANALKARAQAASRNLDHGDGRYFITRRQHFTGFHGESVSAEEALAHIAQARSELPPTFERLARARHRHLCRLAEALRELA